MHNHDIIFDKESKKIGLVASDCDKANGDTSQKNRNYNNLNFKVNNTCENDIKFYRFLCFLASAVILFLIVFFAYSIRKLRREGKFFWINLNEDIGKYYLNNFQKNFFLENNVRPQSHR